MLAAREIDERERVLVAQNLAHFQVSGAGHEAMAVLARHLTDQDWLHLHYRDKSLLLARGMPVEEFFLSLLCRAGSHSKGRQMSANFSVPALKICSMPIPVANNALQAVGIAAAIKNEPDNPLVVCSVGDGGSQQGEFLEAVAEAVRWQLPVLFIIEDNQYSLSTPTASKTFFDLPSGPSKIFYGLDICYIDGVDVEASDNALAKLVADIRAHRGPQLAVMRFERLSSHTSADDQTVYRPPGELAYGRACRDPLPRLRQWLLGQGVGEEALQALESRVREDVRQAVEQALRDSDPQPTLLAKVPYPAAVTGREECRGDSSAPRLTMREAINAVLDAQLAGDPRVFLYGEDIEDPKGDVFGVTSGLSTAFPGRVVNACLSESTIIGTAIGRALAGQRPVVFIQFADFLPLGFNQILSELGSMYWRTDGAWQCPVILMVTCGAYKPGLGPFHAQTLESTLAHVPGVDVFMPSFAADAAGLLNAAFASGRPTVFFYPKSCLNSQDRACSADVARQFALPGKARQLSSGEDLTLVSWGNPVAHCEEIAKVLAANGSTVDLFDLRSLSPWDKAAIIASAEKTGRLLVVHEDNHTCGFGAEVLASVAEAVRRPVQMRRVARPDTYIPYHYGSQLEITPSFKRCLEVCAELLGYALEWSQSEEEQPGQLTVYAIGSGPADESVELIRFGVQEGDAVQAGDVVAEVEATKAVVEIRAQAAGVVLKRLAEVGQRIQVNAPLLRMQTGAAAPAPLRVSVRENPGTPRLSPASLPAAAESPGQASAIYLSKPSCVLGGKTVPSSELVSNVPAWTVDDVVKRTGILSRQWVGEGETVVSLAIGAVERLLAQLGEDAPVITAILCSSSTCRELIPSIACQVATHLRGHGKLSKEHFAFDFNAACSGFLYGLRLAGDRLSREPSGCVLLITAEAVSPVLDLADPATVFIFGDAASASLVTARPIGASSLKVHPPLLLAGPDPDASIYLPTFPGSKQTLSMDGIAVARIAYKAMGNAILAALRGLGLGVADVSALVPHPGSKRILQNVAEYAGISPELVRATLADTGNTSSSSIPLVLERYWDELPGAGYIALAAFGAGFTTAAAMAQFLGEQHE
jgi:2-oxoisovalerate dehydrogenase E1 component